MASIRAKAIVICLVWLAGRRDRNKRTQKKKKKQLERVSHCCMHCLRLFICFVILLK